MDLNFTAEELAVPRDIRQWVAANLPADISHKVHNALRLSRDDMQRWAKILGKKGWLGWGWPKQFGGPGWNAVQKHLFEEECALAGAPRVVPFGPVMVAPVIMAFGNAPSSSSASCPASPAARCGGARATASRARAPTWPPEVRPSARATTTSSTARRPGPRWASTASGSSAWCAPAAKASRRPASASC
jgi:hypothetical protein